MNKLFKVAAIMEARKIDVTKLNGQQDKMLVRGIVLQGAGCSLYAEIYGELCRAFEEDAIREGDLICAGIQLKCREWRTQQGDPRYETKASLQSWMKINNDIKTF